ncbi:MAG: grasp-with-spasm system SPASM domain peptide maturase [Chitinophagales bacterium]
MTQNKPEYFRLFANCTPVQGAARSTLCDLQRNTYRFIPNLLHEILQKLQSASVEEVKASYNHQYDEGIDQYLHLLTQSEWGFWTDEPESFPSLSLEWNTPSIISNAIIDINEQSDHNYQKIQKELDLLGCKALEIRIYNFISPQNLQQILEFFCFSRLQHIALILPYSTEWTDVVITKIVDKFPRIQQLILHTAPKDGVQKMSKETRINVLFTQNVIDSSNHCGVIHPIYFSPNLSHFTEAQKHNTCLNKKISIDEDGKIKNCPSMKNSYGHHSVNSLINIAQDQAFKEVWSVTKDQINICSDCEFRYICTDCRVYLEDDQNNYSKPKKCNYNPYTTKWKTEP